jgi:Flp pilus assembly protein TadD
VEQFDAVLKFFTLALKIDSTDAPAWEGQGIARMSRGDHVGGVRALARAVSLSPLDPEFLVNLCQAHNLRGAYRAAIESCSQALRVDAYDAAAHHQLAATYAALGDSAQMQHHLLHLRDLDPGLARSLETLLQSP